MNTLSKKIILILIGIIFLESAYLSLFFLNRQPVGGYGSKVVKPVTGFLYRDDFTCEIVHSTRNKKAKFSFRGLNSNTPYVSVDDGVWNLLIKQYDTNQYPDAQPDEGYIVLRVAEESFTTNTFGIWKDNGLLVHTATDTTQPDWRGHQAIAEKGRCK